MTDQIVLKFTEVSKSFGPIRVLRGISFDVKPGHLLTLLGPNGAGKSTTISIATGLSAPDQGHVDVFGYPSRSLAAKRSMGFVPQETSFPNHITPLQLLKFMSAHYPNPISVAKIAEDLNFSKILKSPLKVLSGGQRRLISIAAAFIGKPPLVILDEPTVGLDLEVRKNIWSYLKDFTKNGGSILMTTHYLAEAEEMASHVIVLSKGEIIQTGHPQEIKKRYGFKKISFSTKDTPPTSISAACQADNTRWEIKTKNPDQELRTLLDWGQATDIEVVPLGLEEILGELCH